MSTGLKALTGFLSNQALNITSEAMLELLDLSPRLKKMFLAKNFRREIERVQQEVASMPGWRSLDVALPAVHKCVDPFCAICKTRRVEIN